MTLPTRNMTANPCRFLTAILPHAAHGGCPGLVSLLPGDIVMDPSAVAQMDYTFLARQFGVAVATGFYPNGPTAGITTV